jgi:tetratricopeptide (TPR) repeat protein
MCTEEAQIFWLVFCFNYSDYEIMTIFRQGFHALPAKRKTLSFAMKNDYALNYSRALQAAVEHHNAGALGPARAVYEELLTQRPNDPEVLHLLGLVYAQLDQVNQGIDLICKAIDVRPGEQLYHLHLAQMLRVVGQWQAAVNAVDRAIALAPGESAAYMEKARALCSGGLHPEALDVLEVVLPLHADNALVLSFMGDALQAMGQAVAAMAHYEAALQQRPACKEALTGKGSALLAAEQWKEAVLCFDQLVATVPDNASVYFHRAVALQALRQWEAAILDYGQAIDLQADFVQAHCNRANVYQGLGQFSLALQDYERALGLQADCAQAKYNKSLLLLLLGDFVPAWPLYEWRWHKEQMRSQRLNCVQAQWTGIQPLAGRTVLLHCEQGLGDGIQFVRYAPMVHALGARVLIRAPRSLITLFGSLGPDIRCLSINESSPDFDYHCPLMSLPLAFGTELPSIPASPSYLAASPEREAHWRRRLGTKGRKRIGLVCSGSTSHPDDHQRSISLEMLLQALPPQFDYYCLQNELRPVDRAFMEREGLVHFFGSDLQDFAATAALCVCMDAVVSVDTSVAHLAGALGVHTFVLLPQVPDWRWLLDRRDSPWYPSMQLYRQDANRQWPPVLAQLAADLGALS